MKQDLLIGAAIILLLNGNITAIIAATKANKVAEDVANVEQNLRAFISNQQKANNTIAASLYRVDDVYREAVEKAQAKQSKQDEIEKLEEKLAKLKGE